MKKSTLTVDNLEIKYNRFILETVNYIYKTRKKNKNKVYNIYCEDDSFWVKLEDQYFVDLIDRILQKTKIIDPIFHIDGDDIMKLMEIPEDQIPLDELEENLEIFKEDLEVLLKEDIPFELYQKWIVGYNEDS